MPRLNDETMEQFAGTGTFGFSGTRIDELGATEYTLVGIALDDSGSVSPYARDIEEALKKIVQACKFSPRADNLMHRVISFGNRAKEVNGFKLLEATDLDDFDNILTCGSMTALFEATENIVKSVTEYGRTLTENDFSTNGIIFVITDGMENASNATSIQDVEKAFKNAVQGECLESLVSVLIGVNTDHDVDQYLQDFKDEAGFTQYINMGDATPKNLAKLAEFVSKSISSQSQALGTGGQSTALTF